MWQFGPGASCEARTAGTPLTSNHLPPSSTCRHRSSVLLAQRLLMLPLLTMVQQLPTAAGAAGEAALGFRAAAARCPPHAVQPCICCLHASCLVASAAHCYLMYCRITVTNLLARAASQGLVDLPSLLGQLLLATRAEPLLLFPLGFQLPPGRSAALQALAVAIGLRHLTHACTAAFLELPSARAALSRCVGQGPTACGFTAQSVGGCLHARSGGTAAG